MEAPELQQQLFLEIKRNIPAHLSATEEIARALNVSVDSVYRRMRGEKTISLDELHTLCAHYKISLDQLMNLQTGSFPFQGNLLNSRNFRYDAYLSTMAKTIAHFNNAREREFYWLGKDVPIFHHFIFREIAAFKYFFWMKTIFHFPEFEQLQFRFDLYNDELFAIGQKIISNYCALPSIEIWNVENINFAVRQIEFYRDSHMFESDQDALLIYEAFEKLIDHIEKEAERGYKFEYGDPEMKPVASYRVYFNEVVLGDNSMIVVMDGVKMVLLPHTAINYMTTRDISLCENMYNYFQSLMKRSTLISKVSEKERSKFFRMLRERIAKRKDALKL